MIPSSSHTSRKTMNTSCMMTLQRIFVLAALLCCCADATVMVRHIGFNPGGAVDQVGFRYDVEPEFTSPIDWRVGGAGLSWTQLDPGETIIRMEWQNAYGVSQGYHHYSNAWPPTPFAYGGLRCMVVHTSNSRSISSHSSCSWDQSFTAPPGEAIVKAVQYNNFVGPLQGVCTDGTLGLLCYCLTGWGGPFSDSGCGEPCTGSDCPSCDDGVQNQGEEDVDCGGPCLDLCPPGPTCEDSLQNQNETGVDCGGPCAPCPTCSDEILNQGEVEPDCGGPCEPCICEPAESDICHFNAACMGTASAPGVPDDAGVSVHEDSDGNFACSCYPEQLGHGYGTSGCSNNGWNVRVVFLRRSDERLTQMEEDNLLLLMGGLSCTPGSTDGCDHVHYTRHSAYSPYHLGANVLFPNTEGGKEAAQAAKDAFNAASRRRSGTFPPEVDGNVGARVYRWTAGTTADPIQVLPAGMELTSVHFETSCAENGCWVLSVDYTVGHSDSAIAGQEKGFNTFYLPYAVGSDGLSYDYDYGGDGSSIMNSFLPKNFPCRVSDYTGGALPTESTLCCFGSDFDNTVSTLGGSPSTGLLGNYRTTEPFATYARSQGSDNPSCATTKPEDVEPNYYQGLSFLGIQNTTGDVDEAQPTTPGVPFEDMPISPGITHYEIVDAFVGMYKGVIKIDEKELRTKAGLLTGTVGVEHTVDFFLGYVNFKPATTTVALDSLAAQTAIHVEKTSFFSVSTHGTNDYTFLEYVNLRLVAVYVEDNDFSSTSESSSRTVRTDSDGQFNYVQVTFTLGAQYKVDDDDASFPLIPLDAVRAGHGTFFDSAEDLTHKCVDYDGSFDAPDGLLGQDCAPQVDMCVSPSSIPDSFVVFNIPLGEDYFDQTARGPSATLSNNIFVDMVISATEAHQGGADPNDGGEPMQMKTTLTASIPIVEGGINIFCDGFTAKTDLKDVANADIVVGSASTADELTRLRIMKDISSTQLGTEEITRIDSDSIEAGLMTLVLKGNESYFQGTNTGRALVTIELEDVITIHIMDSTDGDGDGTSKDTTVTNLLAMAPDDNSDSNGLETDGYKLNGAFEFTIDRPSQRAHLEPLPALTAACPFNPPRPTGGTTLETCVTRRDVRYRGYPARTGAFSTAMELCAGGTCPIATNKDSDEAMFFSTILGNNDYARTLGPTYANVIFTKYDLNGRYRRAYFINPGYEWTPTQTGGTPIFSVSQKLYLFALITLDEKLTDESTAAGRGADGADLTLPSARRRMLLQSTPSNVDEALQDGESSIGGGVFEFQTTPSQMMAKAFEVPQDRVATFTVKLQLTQAEACMSDSEVQGSIRETLDDYLEGVATPFQTVQITRMTVDRAGVQCTRRSIRSLLSSFSEATVDATMLVVFEKGGDSVIALEDLAKQPGVLAVAPLSVSPKVATSKPTEDWVAPARKEPERESSSSNVAIIAGAAAGGAVVLIAGILALVFMRKKRSNDREVITAVTTINVEDLKHQLANDA